MKERFTSNKVNRPYTENVFLLTNLVLIRYFYTTATVKASSGERYDCCKWGETQVLAPLA